MSIKVKNTRISKPERAAAKKASNYHHGALRDALIHAAREILESQGYEALTLRAAARRVGVSQAAPYNHFADKAALLAAIAAQGFSEFAAAMRQEMDAEVEPQARLNATGIAYVGFATSNPGLFKLMFGSSAHQASGDPELDAARTSAYEVLRCGRAFGSCVGASPRVGRTTGKSSILGVGSRPCDDDQRRHNRATHLWREFCARTYYRVY